MVPKSMRHPGLEFPRIPFLGTSWYGRGFVYWIRRAMATLFVVLVCVFPVWGVGIVIDLIARDTRGPARSGLLAVAILVICWSFYTGFRSIAQTKREEHLLLTGQQDDGGAKKAQRAGKGAGLGLGAAAYGGAPIAGAILVVGQLFIVGWLAALLIKTLGRYSGPPEIRAILAVRDWYQQHPEIPNDQRPTQFRQ
ncbi:hypothetical protein ACIBCN_11815 [Nocardia sp. NPDC051052]|uniref:hypothetical protein n=1 Tax=Nocardia sp. NPDC051052 TaxID=3364322 RepID=UPI0037B7AF25